ncbi:MAG TPA: DUF3551 domain-containing protein [Xanthobacteraceae bacterium]|nr:DUF3551 domain-containing protein [Xanthobacteraceae bacterium]
MRRRFYLYAVLVAAAIAASASVAEAQNYPWCAQYSGRGGGAMNCGFTSFAQCMATIQGAGGFCIANTLYQPPSKGSAPAHRSRKHSHKGS